MLIKYHTCCRQSDKKVCSAETLELQAKQPLYLLLGSQCRPEVGRLLFNLLFPPLQKTSFADGSCIFHILLLGGFRTGSMKLFIPQLLTDISFLHWLREINGKHGWIYCRSPERGCCSAFPSFLLGNTLSAPWVHTTNVFRSLNVSKEMNLSVSQCPFLAHCWP